MNRDSLIRMIEMIPVPVAIFDRNMNYLAASTGWYENHQLTEKNLVGKNHYEIVQDIPEKWKLAHQSALKGITLRDEEDEWIKVDGTKEYVRWLATPWFMDQEIGGIILYSELVTKRVVREEELRNKEMQASQFLSTIVENLPDMIFVKDAKDLRFVLFNKAGEELLGHKREDLIGKNDYDFFPETEADFFTQKDREVLSGNEVVDIPEEPIHTRFGLRILHTKKYPLKNEKGESVYLLGISEDITDKKRSDELFRKQTFDLKKSNEDLEQFAYVASHDLQQPLRTIGSFIQLIEKKYSQYFDEEGKSYFNYVTGSVKDMHSLILDLLNYSRTGRDIEYQDVDLNLVMVHVLQNLKKLIEENNTIVHYDQLPVIRSDQTMMMQLFQNLIQNAIKFRSDENPVIDIQFENLPGEWRFSFRDNSLGIPEEYKDKIFVIFQRIHSQPSHTGTGIGLAICKKIVERMGGRIWYEPNHDEGTTFFFILKKAPL